MGILGLMQLGFATYKVVIWRRPNKLIVTLCHIWSHIYHVVAVLDQIPRSYKEDLIYRGNVKKIQPNLGSLKIFIGDLNCIN